MKAESAGTLDQLVARVAAALRKAQHVCVLTGAGTSAESGIPTFRDALTGLWSRFRPEELATPEAFERDPETVWSWYEWRRELIRQAQPNAGHFALAELARRVPRLTLVTQNVDGLHQRAGSPNVLEYHGNILRDRCTVEQIVADRSEDARAGCPAAPRAEGCCVRMWSGSARRSRQSRCCLQPQPPRTATHSCPSGRRRWSTPLRAWPKWHCGGAPPSSKSTRMRPT